MSVPPPPVAPGSGTASTGQAVQVQQLRLIVPTHLLAEVLTRLRGASGVAHLVHVPGAASEPPGELVFCDVARESVNAVVEELQRLGVHHHGAIIVESLDTVVSDAAASAESRAPGHGADALVWEALESNARLDATLTPSFLIFMSVAATIAAIGILLDAPILVVGAMVVGPEYGPLAALCVAIVRRRSAAFREAATTLSVGLAVAAVASLVATVAFRLTEIGPDDYELGARQLTAFISHPDGMAAVVAVLAGVVGMLALTQARSGTLIGVLVSVTTIPAVGNIGAATAYGEWSEVGGAALQLAINVAGLVVAGTVTIVVQARVTGAEPASTSARPAGGR